MSALVVVACFLLRGLTPDAIQQALKNNLAPIVNNLVEDVYTGGHRD
jgi:hypothetical protein